VQPGVVRDDLKRFLAPHGLFFAPETSTRATRRQQVFRRGSPSRFAGGRSGIDLGCVV